MANGILDRAASMLGMNERDQQAAIADYLKTGGANLDPATQAWCAAFVNSTLKQSGLEGTGSNMARSFLNYGEATDAPQVGDLAVFSRGDPNGPYGHVGFFQGLTPDGKFVKVLGGNQDDAVSVKQYPVDRLLGYRRIPGQGGPSVQPASDPAYTAGPGRGSIAGYRKAPGTYSGGEYVPPQDATFYDPRSPLLPGNDGNGAGASIGSFIGGPGEVARRNIENFKVVPADAAPGNYKPTNFQQMAARQAMEGDQSQRARLLRAAGLDPTGKTRLAPRSADAGVLSKLMEGLKLPTAEEEQKRQTPFGILGNIFNLFA